MESTRQPPKNETAARQQSHKDASGRKEQLAVALRSNLRRRKASSASASSSVKEE